MKKVSLSPKLPRSQGSKVLKSQYPWNIKSYDPKVQRSQGVKNPEVQNLEIS